ncbi:MAG: hypothetical protein HUJ25_01550 [Crocinitomicaceae bacterium]|nr:hypothetical protein [Crocinitomicaceae bacterium]
MKSILIIFFLSISSIPWSQSSDDCKKDSLDAIQRAKTRNQDFQNTTSKYFLLDRNNLVATNLKLNFSILEELLKKDSIALNISEGQVGSECFKESYNKYMDSVFYSTHERTYLKDLFYRVVAEQKSLDTSTYLSHYLCQDGGQLIKNFRKEKKLLKLIGHKCGLDQNIYFASLDETEMIVKFSVLVTWQGKIENVQFAGSKNTPDINPKQIKYIEGVVQKKLVGLKIYEPCQCRNTAVKFVHGLTFSYYCCD